MKKLRIVLLLTALTLTLLAGCGKSEEEKAKTAYEQMKEEAKNEVEESKKVREDIANTTAELEEKWSSKIDKAYNQFINETDPHKIISLAEGYNQTYEEMASELKANKISGIALDTTANITGVLEGQAGYISRIPEYAYKARSLYFENSSELSNYEYMACYYNVENNRFLFLEETTNQETGNPDSFSILKEDGSSLTIHISEFDKNDYSYAKLYSVSDKSIIFETSYNASSYTYEVDISGNSPKLIYSEQTNAASKYEEDFLTAGNEPTTVDGINRLFQSMCLR